MIREAALVLADGSYLGLSAEHIFRDYQFSVDNQVMLPK